VMKIIHMHILAQPPTVCAVSKSHEKNERGRGEERAREREREREREGGRGREKRKEKKGRIENAMRCLERRAKQTY